MVYSSILDPFTAFFFYDVPTSIHPANFTLFSMYGVLTFLNIESSIIRERFCAIEEEVIFLFQVTNLTLSSQEEAYDK